MDNEERKDIYEELDYNPNTNAKNCWNFHLLPG